MCIEHHTQIQNSTSVTWKAQIPIETKEEIETQL